MTRWNGSGRVGEVFEAPSDRLLAAADQADAMGADIGEHQGGAAKAAFGGEAADIPVRAAAAGAMVHLVLAIGDMVAAPRRIVRMVPASFAENRNKHWFYSLIAAERGSDEPFYYIDELNER